MTDRTPPTIELPQPNTAYVAALTADLNTVYERGLAALTAGIAMHRLAEAERARLLGQPVEGADGRVGVVKHVGINCDGRVVAQMMEWKGGPTTYYAENLTVLTVEA